MNARTNRTVLVLAGLAVMLVAASFGSRGYAAFLSESQPNGLAASSFLAPAAQAAQPTPTPVHVSSQGGGQVEEALPAEGAAPTPLPAATSTGSVLPETGRRASLNLFPVLAITVLLSVAIIVLGLWLRSSRRRANR